MAGGLHCLMETVRFVLDALANGVTTLCLKGQSSSTKYLKGLMDAIFCYHLCNCVGGTVEDAGGNEVAGAAYDLLGDLAGEATGNTAANEADGAEGYTAGAAISDAAGNVMEGIVDRVEDAGYDIAEDTTANESADAADGAAGGKSVNIAEDAVVDAEGDKFN